MTTLVRAIMSAAVAVLAGAIGCSRVSSTSVSEEPDRAMRSRSAASSPIAAPAAQQPEPAMAPGTIKIAVIEALSGAFAPTGNNLLRSYQTFAEVANRENWNGMGYRIEIAGFDNQRDVGESLIQLRAAIDQGFHYVAQGTSSEVAAAFIQAIDENNELHPDKTVVFLNHGAVDPALTNERCSFWHFRFDANSDMKVEALTSVIATDPGVKRVYIIGQDYSFGRQVARAVREYLERKRPDIEIVGEELHPVARVEDFSPYVARIKASAADVVVTGNWGVDLARLLSAANSAGVESRILTLYAGMSSGVMRSVMKAGGERLEGKVEQVGNWHQNIKGFPGHWVHERFKQEFHEDFYATPAFTITKMLSKAIGEARSIEPLKVAFALEQAEITGLGGGVAKMRAADHQVQQAQFISTWTKANGQDVKYDQEDTGYGWKTHVMFDPAAVAKPTSCHMKRPTL